jgi:hypothetical protein
MVVAVMLCGMLAKAPAQATILTFDIGGMSNFSDIPTTYGDNVTSLTNGSFSYGMGNGFTPNITVDYVTRATSNGSIVKNNLEWWNFNYGNLTNVAFPTNSSGHFGELTLTPGAGFAVKLNGFDLGGWSQIDHSGQTIRILDDLGILQEFTNFTVLGAGPSHSPFSFTDLVSRSGDLRIQYAFNDWNVGIDNIHFEQVSPVPIPGAILLYGAGLAGLAAFGRLKGRMKNV